MKRFVSIHFLMRCCALLSVLLSLGQFLLFDGWSGLGREALMCSLAGGNMLLCMYPLSYEDLRFSKWMLAGAFVAFHVFLCFPRQGGRFAAVSIFVIALLGIFLTVCTVRKFSCLRSLFQGNSVLYRVEDEGRSLSIYLLSSFLILYLALNHFMVAFPAIALFVWQWMRAYSGRTLFMSSSREKELKERALRMVCDLNEYTVEESERMNRMYERITRYIRKERPFLREEFSIHDMAHEMNSNRAYVSHVINVCSKMNFRQLLNYYRVQYAVELMEKHPSMKLLEVALTAGFHSNVNFNLSFKLIKQMSPSEYRKNKLLLP